MEINVKIHEESDGRHIPLRFIFLNAESGEKRGKDRKRNEEKRKKRPVVSVFRESGRFQLPNVISSSHKHLHNYTRNRQNNANNESQAKWLAVSLYLIVIVNGLLYTHA